MVPQELCGSAPPLERFFGFDICGPFVQSQASPLCELSRGSKGERRGEAPNSWKHGGVTTDGRAERKDKSRNSTINGLSIIIFHEVPNGAFLCCTTLQASFSTACRCRRPQAPASASRTDPSIDGIKLRKEGKGPHHYHIAPLYQIRSGSTNNSAGSQWPASLPLPLLSSFAHRSAYSISSHEGSCISITIALFAILRRCLASALHCSAALSVSMDGCPTLNPLCELDWIIIKNTGVPDEQHDLPFPDRPVEEPQKNT